jgi:hypothetical protein
MKPEARVGRTANLMIFLGILYAALHLVALLGKAGLASRSFGLPGLFIALGVIGLGYGIRYSSIPCLYAATIAFAALTLYNLISLLTAPAIRSVIRFLLSALALYGLCRSIPAMWTLKATNTTPIRTSRYGEYFLRRWKKLKLFKLALPMQVQSHISNHKLK